MEESKEKKKEEKNANPDPKKELREKIIETLKTIYDPEIPVNIYDLGFIYDIDITENDEVAILMTLTAPNCPEAQTLPMYVEYAIREIPEVKNVRVMLTFDPPWSPDNLSDDVRLTLGLY